MTLSPPAAMGVTIMYDRGEVACHLCFNDKVLREWIKEEAVGRGKCPWWQAWAFSLSCETSGTLP
jgi:hypothetical protein